MNPRYIALLVLCASTCVNPTFAMQNRQQNNGITSPEKLVFRLAKSFTTACQTIEKHIDEKKNKTTLYGTKITELKTRYEEGLKQLKAQSHVSLPHFDISIKKGLKNITESTTNETFNQNSKGELISKIATLQRLQERNDADEKSNEKSSTMAINLVENLLEKGKEFVFNYVTQEQKGNQAKEVENIRQKGAYARTVAVTKQITDFIKENPGKIVTITAGAVVVTYLGYRLIKFAMNRLNKYLDTPDVVKETSRRSLKESILGKAKVEPVYLNEIILAPALKAKLNNIATDIKNAHDANTFLFNLLLYGPPGTGKTMYAKALSYYTGLDYAIIPGSSLAKLPPSEALIKLNEILAWARASHKGCIIVIDEAESLLPNRLSEGASERTRKLVTEFLAQIEKPIDKKLMFVLVTNIPEALDKAVLNRMSNWIEVPAPKEAELVKLIKLYSHKATKQGIKIGKDLEQNLDELASMAEEAGIVGREIETIFTSKVVQATLRTTDSTATYKLIKDVFKEHIKELKDRESFLNMGR